MEPALSTKISVDSYLFQGLNLKVGISSNAQLIKKTSRAHSFPYNLTAPHLNHDWNLNSQIYQSCLWYS